MPLCLNDKESAVERITAYLCVRVCESAPTQQKQQQQLQHWMVCNHDPKLAHGHSFVVFNKKQCSTNVSICQWHLHFYVFPIVDALCSVCTQHFLSVYRTYIYTKLRQVYWKKRNNENLFYRHFVDLNGLNI